MSDLAARKDLSWMQELRPDPQTKKYAPNHSSRQVKSGHYVPVAPIPLPNPKLVIYSVDMANELLLTEEGCNSEEFLRFFSGDITAIPEFQSWCTPYALSIMGSPQYHNCPFKNGNGYGDGRAISIAEVVMPNGKRWEMQLKGGGRTPFCRGADGRAVLRSSIREFLASEAMHNLGISTTRALSLIVSQSETAQRPWYSGNSRADIMGDPQAQISQAPPQIRQMLMAMFQERVGEPDVMITEPCAITCRVATSFSRIGHLELFARRAVQGSSQGKEELEMLAHHVFNREFPDVLPEADLPKRAMAVFDASCGRIAAMVTGWLRVGFCQGNFNCDNCLVGGRTMDYGPFGFMDKYDRSFAKWVGSGDHFGFLNQPGAAWANLKTLATCLEPLLSSTQKSEIQNKLQAARRNLDKGVRIMWCSKLGFEGDERYELFDELEPILQNGKVDFTIFFRQLAELPKAFGNAPDEADDSALLEPLLPAFHSDPVETRWVGWIRKWLRQLAVDGMLDEAGVRMKAVNPKYILREDMLVEAYKKASTGDFSDVQELHELTKRPYDEQPEFQAKYYVRSPDVALTRPGTSVMT